MGWGSVKKTVSSVMNPDPVPVLPLDPGSGMGKKIKIRIRYEHPGPDNISESLKTFCGLEILKFFYPRSGMGKKRIRDKQPGSATLEKTYPGSGSSKQKTPVNTAFVIYFFQSCSCEIIWVFCFSFLSPASSPFAATNDLFRPTPQIFISAT
jgi:hypothetical protein